MKYVQILKSSLSYGRTTGIYMKPGFKVEIKHFMVFQNLFMIFIFSFYRGLSLNSYVSLFVDCLTHDRFFQRMSIVI